MRLFEVVFWGSHGDGNAGDTIYLVRAPDFRSAIEDVRRNAWAGNHNGVTHPLADLVLELGIDLSPHADAYPRILRGPYCAFSYNHGWRAWQRKLDGTEFSEEWEEVVEREPRDS